MPKLNLLAAKKEVEEENAPDFTEVKPLFTQEFKSSCEPLVNFLGWDLDDTMDFISHCLHEVHPTDLRSMNDGCEGHAYLDHPVYTGPFCGEIYSVCVSASDISNWGEYYAYRKELARRKP